jgi:cellulose synthase/poly-beta-1,6-N-acetylglucosamine synthase-like glycosyltransferase
MDADGRRSSGALDVVAPLFADDEVGGVQLGVRIRNRGDNVLARIQDCEFWGIAALGQLGRMRTGTVSLGGNGQFTRLAALRSIGEDPWTDALTEDLALAVTLNIGGWRLTSTPEAWVSQQGLTTLRPLVRQRTRWFQGHMTTAIGRMGDVWRAPALPNGAVLEMSSYLLIPFFIVLPWSVLSQLALYSALVDGGPQLEYGGWGLAGIASFTLWYLLSFSPTLLCGIIYARRQPDIGVVRAIVLAHLLMAWNYILFAACWSAVVRMVRGRTGWVKTARIDEGTAKDPTDAAVPAA